MAIVLSHMAAYMSCRVARCRVRRGMVGAQLGVLYVRVCRRARTNEIIQKRKERTDFALFEKNEDGEQTQDTGDKQKLKSKRKQFNGRGGAPTLTQPSRGGRGGAQP